MRIVVGAWALAILLAGCMSDAPAETPGKAPETAPGSSPEFAPGTGGIRGTLLDDVYRPVAGGLLRLDPSNRTSPTDEEGQFTFSDVPAGTYDLTAESARSKSTPLTVEVRAGQWTQVEMRMRRADRDQAVGNGSEIPIAMTEFAFSPSTATVAVADLLVTLVVRNEGLVPHDFRYEVVHRAPDGEQVLDSDAYAVAPGATKRILLPIFPVDGAVVSVPGANGGVADARDLEVRFSDPDFELLGMTGTLTFTA